MKHQRFHLVTHVLCPYVQRSIIIFLEKNTVYSRTDIDLRDKPAWFKQKSPMGKVPILLINQKYTLFESAVVFEYLDEVTAGSLHPVCSLEKAYHRAWIEFGSSILSKIASLYNAKKATDFQAIQLEIQNKFQLIEGELSGSSFLRGESFHLIDAVYAPIFRYFDIFDTFIHLGTFDLLPKCQLWRNGLKKRSSVQKSVVTDYSNRLMEFFLDRESYLSQLILLKEKQ
jgi:glutathione S-transferase